MLIYRLKLLPIPVGLLAVAFPTALGRRHRITAGSWGPSSSALPRKNSSKVGQTPVLCPPEQPCPTAYLAWEPKHPGQA